MLSRSEIPTWPITIRPFHGFFLCRKVILNLNRRFCYSWELSPQGKRILRTTGDSKAVDLVCPRMHLYFQKIFHSALKLINFLYEVMPNWQYVSQNAGMGREKERQRDREREKENEIFYLQHAWLLFCLPASMMLISFVVWGRDQKTYLQIYRNVSVLIASVDVPSQTGSLFSFFPVPYILEDFRSLTPLSNSMLHSSCNNGRRS